MRRWLAGVLLVTVGYLASPGTVPIYDGVGTDQPYRFVGRSPAPAAVSRTGPVSGGLSPALQLSSPETGPQVLLDLAAGAFHATTSAITLTATPLEPSGSPPRGSFDSNSYRLSVTSGAVLHPDAAQGFLFLRAAVMTKPNPVIVHRTTASSPWVQVATTRAGNDVMSTPFRDLGDYAVVRLPGAKDLSSSGLGLTRVLAIAAGLLVLLTITVLVLRRPSTEQ